MFSFLCFLSVSFPIIPSFSCVFLEKEWREGGGVMIERVKVKGGSGMQCNNNIRGCFGRGLVLRHLS